MKNLFKTLLVFSLLVYAPTANAFQWQVDPDHTEFRFEVTHILTPVTGKFTDFSGMVQFDPDRLDKASFDFTVNVKSVDTQNGKRDTHLRSRDFFDADGYPSMTFKSSKISHIKDNRYSLEGLMTIKDVTKPMTLEFEFFHPLPHPFDAKKLVAGFQTRFVISRPDFNVGDEKFLKMGVVGKDVLVTITMEATREK
jgi:polyisoprenoid-binding protein YceI